MKNFSFNIFNIIFLFSIVLVIILIILPFNLINLEQAQRIAKWKSVYEELKYSFELTNLHEGSIIPDLNQTDKIITEETVLNRVLPYLGEKKIVNSNPYKHGYSYMNGTPVKKCSQYYFKKFIKYKKDILLSVKSNYQIKDKDIPIFLKSLQEIQTNYILFVDINGRQKPNRIGQDIFFINIYSNEIKPLGWNFPKQLRANCSPIGSGVFCSEYYILGGQF